MVSYYHIGVFGVPASSCPVPANTFQMVMHESTGIIEIFFSKSHVLLPLMQEQLSWVFKTGTKTRLLLHPERTIPFGMKVIQVISLFRQQVRQDMLLLSY